MKKRLTTIEKGEPERLERAHREPTVQLTKARRWKQLFYFPEFDPLAQAIAKDDERDRLALRREKE